MKYSLIRKPLFLSLILPALCSLFLLGCIKETSDTARAVSDVFVEHYYEMEDVKGALKYTTESAKETLESELSDIESAGVSEPPEDEPKVKTSLQSEKMLAEDKAVFIWKILAQGVDTLHVKTTMLQTGPGDFWLVSDFEERAAPFAD